MITVGFFRVSASERLSRDGRVRDSGCQEERSFPEEAGNDTGDRPGEFQFWVEREKLTQVHAFPQGYRDLRTNAEGSVLGVVTGVGGGADVRTKPAIGTPHADDAQVELTAFGHVWGAAQRQRGVSVIRVHHVEPRAVACVVGHEATDRLPLPVCVDQGTPFEAQRSDGEVVERATREERTYGM